MATLEVLSSSCRGAAFGPMAVSSGEWFFTHVFDIEVVVEAGDART